MTEEEQRKIFSHNLTQLLERRGYRQADICTELDVAKGTASGWCNGQKMPRMGKLDALAKWLGVPVSALIEENATEIKVLSAEQQKVLDLVEAINSKLSSATPAQLEKIMSVLDLLLGPQ